MSGLTRWIIVVFVLASFCLMSLPPGMATSAQGTPTLVPKAYLPLTLRSLASPSRTPTPTTSPTAMPTATATAAATATATATATAVVTATATATATAIPTTSPTPEGITPRAGTWSGDTDQGMQYGLHTVSFGVSADGTNIPQFAVMYNWDYTVKFAFVYDLAITGGTFEGSYGCWVEGTFDSPTSASGTYRVYSGDPYYLERSGTWTATWSHE